MPSTSPCPLGPSCGSQKKKGRALLLHTAVPKFLQEFLPEFRSSLDACKKTWCCAPQCRPPKARWRFGPQALYIYPPPCLKHVLVCLGSKQQSLASMLNLDPNHNLNPQCSILILICNGSGCLALSFKGSRAQLPMLAAAPHPP